MATLESVGAGLAQPNDSVDQGRSYVFGNGWVRTYNEHVACRAKTGFPATIVGALDAKTFLTLLRKLTDDEITVSSTDKEVVVKGKRSRTKFVLEAELTQAKVQKPESWSKLHPDFADAVLLTADCCGKDENDPGTYCVHVAPKWVEATDLLQMARYNVVTGVKSGVLVRGTSLKGMATLDFSEVAETDSWLHFRNGKGLVYSCRKLLMTSEYPDFAKVIAEGGEKLVLPAALGDAAARCEVFSQENAEANLVEVVVEDGRLSLKGVGAAGEHEERRTAKYSGPRVEFLAAPKLLVELVKRQAECEVYHNEQGWPRLKAVGDNWAYVVVLRKPE